MANASVFIGGGDVGTDPEFTSITFPGGESISGSTANLIVNSTLGGIILGIQDDALAWLINSHGVLTPGQDNTYDIGLAAGIRPKTIYAGTDVIVAGSSVTKGVASGYKIARGATALDASNPTTVATGLASVVAMTVSLRRNSALSSGTAFVTHDTPSGGSVDVYGWLLTGAASTGTELFDWIAVGT